MRLMMCFVVGKNLKGMEKIYYVRCQFAGKKYKVKINANSELQAIERVKLGLVVDSVREEKDERLEHLKNLMGMG